MRTTLCHNKLIGSALSTKLNLVAGEVGLTSWSTLSSPKCSWQVTFNKIAGVGQIWGWRSISSLVGHSLRLPPVSFSHYLLYVVFGHLDLFIPPVTFFHQWKNYAYLISCFWRLRLISPVTFFYLCKENLHLSQPQDKTCYNLCNLYKNVKYLTKSGWSGFSTLGSKASCVIYIFLKSN